MNKGATKLLEQYWDLQVPVDVYQIAKNLGFSITNYHTPKFKRYDIIDREIRIYDVMSPNEERKRLSVAVAIGEALGEEDTYQFACDLLVPPIALKAVVECRNIKDPKTLRTKVFMVPGHVLWDQLKSYGYFL